MSQISIPSIPPAEDVPALRLALSSAISSVVQQVNQQNSSTQVSGGGNRITNVATPTSWNDAVNKRYLDKALEPLQQFPQNPRQLTKMGSAAPHITREGYAVVTFNQLPVGPLQEVTWVVFEIDETDVLWHGNSSAGPGATSTNVTYSISGTSRYTGTGTFNANDYIIWNDPTNGYEINRIKSVVSTTSLTLYSGATVGTRSAYFLSTRATHASSNFYRLNAHSYITDENGVPHQKAEFIGANKCIVAAVSPFKNYNLVANLNHSADSSPAPGLRTMNGAAYTLGAGTATVTVGQTSDIRIPVMAWHSLRNVYAWAQVVPTGGTTGLVLSAMYIDPTLSTVGLIGTCTIGTSSHLSWSIRPDGLNMPPQGVWPPNILPLVTGALDGNANLQTGFTVGGASVLMQPDGFVDFIVTAVGTTTAGGRLGVAVQS